MRPSSTPGPWPRPALEHRLDLARAHRLTVAAAPPGFGKTAILERWVASASSTLLTLTELDRDGPTLAARVTEVLRLQVPGLPGRLAGDAAASGPTGQDDLVARAESLASLLSRALAEHLGRSVVLVLDDVHVLDGHAAAVRFLEVLVRQAPALLHVVLATRTAVPFPVDRLRERGHVLELDGTDFTLSRDETRSWVVAQLGPDGERLGRGVHDVAGGWAAATRAAIETLEATPVADRRARLSRLARDVPFTDLVERVLELASPEAVELLRTVTPLPWFTPELCAALGAADAPEVLRSLRRRGLFVEAVTAEPDGYALTELARDHLRRSRPLDDDERTRVLRTAAAHWAARGRLDEVVRCELAAGDPVRLASTLVEAGDRLVTTGHVELLERAVAALPDDLEDPRLDRIAGTAAQSRGDWAGAQARFERAVAATPADQPLDPGLAWRLGLIHHMRGDLGTALEVYARGVVTEPTRDSALLLAWTATVHWLRGEADRCAALAARALDHATAVDDPQALAAAHTVLAMLAALEGDRRANDAHYLRALEFAEAAGDVLQIVRIRVNRSSHHVEEGRYDAGLAELEIAIGLAETTGYGPFAAIALSNRAEAQMRLGRLEEAADDLAASVAIWREMGSRMVAYALNHLGDLHLLRDERARAVAAHTEALEASLAHGDLQAQVPALAGLARAHLDDEPERARELADRALAKNDSLAQVEALVVAGAAAAACGDTAAATRLALVAVDAAHERRDRVGLGDALLLRAGLETPEGAGPLLDEAIAVWTEVGDPTGLARAQLARAAHLGPDEARVVAEDVRQRMSTTGCRRLVAAAEALLARVHDDEVPDLEVRVLGGFRLLVDGEPVAANAWQSRKARDLFKVLVVRRGRPVPRDHLLELLWPGEDAAVTANRLNVALSTVRSVLDPSRRHDSDRWVVTEQDAVRLSPDGLVVDVEDFLADAGEGLRLHRSGRPSAGALVLRRAEATYRGEVLEEDVYEQWAIPLREEARATYVEVAAVLARHDAADGRPGDAVRYLLRILERDQFDERAHLELVRTLSQAGRHGEARRRYLAYDRAMRELDVEPAPFPQ